MSARHFLAGCAVTAVLAYAGCNLPIGLVTRVIDGDTVEARPCLLCAHEPVRLYGIDAPERNTPEGQAAARALERLLDVDFGPPVAVTLEQFGRDRYGRPVAIVRMPFRGDLGEAMVRAGHALPMPRYGGERYVRAYREAGEARNQSNLIGPKSPPPILEYRKP